MGGPIPAGPLSPVGDGAIAGVLGQILLKQGDLGSQLAVISEQLKAVPDHESRLRALERFRFTLLGGAIVVSLAVSAVVTWFGLMVVHH